MQNIISHTTMRLGLTRSMSTTTSILDSVEKCLDVLKRVEDVVETVEEVCETVEDVYEGGESLNNAIPELCDEWERILGEIKDDFR